jgi:uncharacterized membrane protein
MRVAVRKNVVRYLLLGCCLLGGILSAVSLHSHYSTSSTDYCDLNATFNCDLVNRSTYSEFYGVPVALIGLLGYLLLFALSLRTSRLIAGLRFIASLIGLAFALCLAYVEAYILAVWCLLCIGSLATISAITLLAGIDLRQTWSRASTGHAKGAYMSKCRSLPIIIVVGLFAFFSAVQPSTSQTSNPHQQDHPTAQHQHSPQNHDQHFAEVNKHGDTAMGFSHLKTTHHFRLTSSGGSVEVQANDPADTASRDQIRVHLRDIAKAFKEGDFSAPKQTHGRVPPGVPTMQKLKHDITYKYEETAGGGKVLISTANPEALKAVHEFLRFQIQDHQTGDPPTVQK